MAYEKNILRMDLDGIMRAIRRDIRWVWDMARKSADEKEFLRLTEDYLTSREEAVRQESPGVKIAVADAVRSLRVMLACEGDQLRDLSTGEMVDLRTFSMLRGTLRGSREAGVDFMTDMYHLLRALAGNVALAPSLERAKRDSRRWESGLEREITDIRKENRYRITELLIKKIEQRSPEVHRRYLFPPQATHDQKRAMVGQWWGDFRFHLSMAIRSPRELNRYLDYSLPGEVMSRLAKAQRKEMPFFVTPYYASLLDTSGCGYDDLTIRSYVIYSQELVDAYGSIKAWEKEDEARPGCPNAAGWVIPDAGNIHRRYPDVAILIPDSMGRGCGGLCAPCQRMYDFQNKRLNFEFSNLKPNETWDTKLRRLMRYFESDPSLRDILLTGGDALMSQNKTLRKMLDAFLLMAVRKREASHRLPPSERHATIERVRLGTRLPVYLPMRIDDELIEILSDFRQRGERLGIKQFIIQTHFESPLEMTPESRRAIRMLLSAGWLVTNQEVFTVAASRRGHSARLRQILSREGVIPYYTFTVKGFAENHALFAPNSRSIQEIAEEKCYGAMDDESSRELMGILSDPPRLQRTLPKFLSACNMPFVATDRNVLNLPGIGKSMSFETIGLTSDGRRILLFDHDTSRAHSPVIASIGKVCITENKSVAEYLRQLESMGENPGHYASIWRYTHAETEPRFALFRL